MKYLISIFFLFNIGLISSQDFKDYKFPKVETSHQLINSLNYTSSILKSVTLKQKSLDIHFYGQSIIRGIDEDHIKKALNELNPDVSINIENNAIGGYQAPKLVRTAEHDLYPNYADLIIFHVYGGLENGELEEIFCDMSNNLSSDVIIFDHHISYVDNQLGQDRLNDKQDKDSKEIEKLAIKYNFGFIGVRAFWKNYLKLNPSLTIKSLLKDNVHPNEHGKFLLERIITEHIKDGISKNRGICKKVISKHIKEDSKSISFEFTGNKIELNAISSNRESEFEVYIDGIPVANHNELYAVTRPTSFPRQWWPAFNRIELNTAIQQREEEWTIYFSDFNFIKESFNFKLVGNISGFQGNGTSGEDFISDNKAIEISALDQAIFPIYGNIKEEGVKNFKVDFKVYPLFTNPVKINKDGIICIAKLLENKTHTVEFKIIKGSLLESTILLHKPESSITATKL